LLVRLEVLSALTTLTSTFAGVAIMALVTAPVSLVALTKVVVTGAPFHMTVAPFAKPLPFTVRVKLPPPAVTDAGLRLLMVADGVGMMENVPGAEVLVSPFTTVTDADPLLAISAAPMGAVSWLALTNVVVRGVEFQTIWAPERKPAPLTVSVNAEPPAMADGGVRLLMVAVGPWIAKVAGDE